MITYVIPTRNRPRVLERTLAALGALRPHPGEVLVIDNASTTPPHPTTLPNGLGVRVITIAKNLAAAARNVAIREAHAASQWLVMLDDDSYPLDLGFVSVLERSPHDVGVVAGEVLLPSQHGIARHESGGLPEVFIGCGAAIRTELFRGLAGYDETFDYYAEEYDLSARVLLAGWRIAFSRRFRVMHHKETQGRAMSRILANLVRNNAWVALRYAPDDATRHAEVARTLRRYAAIAWKERALHGYARGVARLAVSAHAQPRRSMTLPLWQRFTGFSAAVEAIEAAGKSLGNVALIAPGKNAHVVAEAALACGARMVDDPRNADTLLIATLSPGPMIDAAAEWQRLRPDARVLLPWRMGAASVSHFTIHAA